MSSISTLAEATSIEEPRRSAGKDILRKCGGVGDRLEKRDLWTIDFDGLSVAGEPSDTDDCFSNFASVFEIVLSRALKLVDLFTSAASGLSTMVMALLRR